MIYDNSATNVPCYGFPSNQARYTSKEAVELCDGINPPCPPLERNRDIVNYSELLLACPADMQEQQRSGTWATIRYARKIGRKIVIIWPDGSSTVEN